MAISTRVIPFDPDRITEAVRYELARAGQVYFLHNQIETLGVIAEQLASLVPEARVLTAHGQMREAALERTLARFQEGGADILLATTIIENGLDLPRVNTLIVNRADRFGLAQLYQIRGRVGRSSRRAFAWLLVPPEREMSESARPRLAALREFSELGAGFRIAALDLELRGAGNLLGAAQHGHLEAVGFDLYHRLLEEAVANARGEVRRSRCSMNLRFRLPVPESWLSDMQQRMWLYKRLSAAEEAETLDRLAEEVRDRFGPPPDEVELLFEHARLRVTAESLGYTAIHREGDALRFEGATPESGFRSPLPSRASPAVMLGCLGEALAMAEAAQAARESGTPGGAPRRRPNARADGDHGVR